MVHVSHAAFAITGLKEGLVFGRSFEANSTVGAVLVLGLRGVVISGVETDNERLALIFLLAWMATEMANASANFAPNHR